MTTEGPGAEAMTDTRAGEWVPQVPLAERIKAVEPDVRDAIVAAERQRIKAAVAEVRDDPALDGVMGLSWEAIEAIVAGGAVKPRGGDDA
jgi:hypothetical protein